MNQNKMKNLIEKFTMLAITALALIIVSYVPLWLPDTLTENGLEYFYTYVFFVFGALGVFMSYVCYLDVSEAQKKAVNAENSVENNLARVSSVEFYQ